MRNRLKTRIWDLTVKRALGMQPMVRPSGATPQAAPPTCCQSSHFAADWPLRFQSHSACCVSACFLRSAFNLYCRFVGIHRRDGGHGLTFVYFLKDVLGLNVVVPLPCGPGRRQTLRCVCDQTPVRPLQPFESLSLDDTEMLLAERISQPLVPPVCCCRQCHTVHSLPCSALFFCLLKLRKHLLFLSGNPGRRALTPSEAPNRCERTQEAEPRPDRTKPITGPNIKMREQMSASVSGKEACKKGPTHRRVPCLLCPASVQLQYLQHPLGDVAASAQTTGA